MHINNNSINDTYIFQHDGNDQVMHKNEIIERK